MKLNAEKVACAIEQAGSIRKAAPILEESYNVVQSWIKQNGYEVVKRATLVKVGAGESQQQSSKAVG